MPESSLSFQTNPEPRTSGDLVSLEAARLVASSTIELSTNGESTIRRAAESLPPGTSVFVPKMPTQSLEDKLFQIRILKEVELNPVPHIVARQITSERALRGFLDRAVADEEADFLVLEFAN